jgi:hypothetical protein
MVYKTLFKTRQTTTIALNIVSERSTHYILNARLDWEKKNEKEIYKDN